MNIYISVCLFTIINFFTYAQTKYTFVQDDYKYDFNVKTFKQSATIKRANDLYQRLLYVRAAKKYEKIKLSKHNSPSIRIQLANSYYYMKNLKQAFKNFSTVPLQDYQQKDLYNYFQTAKMTNNDKVAQEISLFLCKHFDNPICNEPNIDTNIMRFEISPININTSKSNDFGAYPINDGELLFLSDRTHGLSRRKNGYSKNGFINIYSAKKINNEKYSPAKRLKGQANSKYNEGPFCFSPNGKYVYFTRNETKSNDEQIRHLAIYIANVSPKGKWGKARRLAINDATYSTAHPALNSEGTKMVFVSTQKNGFGGTDLYIADVLENGEIVRPKNLGNIINTERNELFPYIDKDENLYFASDGHLGFGGLDVFIVKMDGEEPTKVMNCGKNINSAQDDFALILNKDQQTGYISSNRKGTDDIYAITKKYNPVKKLNIQGQIVSTDSKIPVYDAQIELKTDNSMLYLNTQTDILGNFNFTLPDSIVNNEDKGQLTIKKMGYQTIKFPLTKLISDTIINIELQQLTKGKPLQEIVIYFDRGTERIREESKIELQKVVDLLNEHPTMLIEAAAHTDCSSSKDFNVKLSKRRANAAVKYIRERSYNPKQIYGKGYGETQPIIDCRCKEVAPQPCSAEDLQINRRVEFVIKRW